MFQPPQRLQSGARIAVVAPAGIYNEQGLRDAVEWLEQQGFVCVLGASMGAKHRYMAGSDGERLADLNWALHAPDIDAVWMARGGYGINRLLAQVDFSGLDDRPVIGFSDVTSLLVALYQEAGKSGIHGPVLHSLLNHPSDESVAHLLRLLNGGLDFSLQGDVWRQGAAEGPVVGGNLCMLASLAGTPWQLSADGCILLLEEVGEPPYRVDRMLQQLVSAGVFDGVRGVVVGEFRGFTTPDGTDWGLRDLICEAVDVPVLGGVMVGHGEENRAFVFGAWGRIAGDYLVFDGASE